jgi:catechol 2,3-dioxygenase-like lactoylglutathione lyase family enzyme
MSTTGQATGIEGGVATVFVRSMDEAVRFYTETLGLALQFRAGDHWAQVDAGQGFLIGLHPAGEDSKTRGVEGGVQIGLSVNRPIAEVVSGLQSRGVAFDGGVQDDGPVKLAFFKDPDGNVLYLVDTKH